MAYDGLMDDMRLIARNETPSRVPFLALSEEFDVRWYDHGSYQQISDDPQLLADCTIAAVEAFDYDWAWLQVDDCMEFEPLGVGVKGEGNILRATCEYLPATRVTLDALKQIDPHRDGRLPILLEAIRKVRDHFGDTVCVCGRTAAPFSSTALLYGIEETMMLTVLDPDLLHATNDFFVELQANLSRAQFEAGAHAVWLGDCNAMSNLISVAHYSEFAFGACRELVDRQHQIGLLSLLHNSEIKGAYIAKQTELGIDVMSVGPEADIVEAREITRGKVALCGNLDPVNVLMNGTPDQVVAECERIIGVCKPGGGYALNSGEMIPRDTPEENMRAMAACARRLGAY